ncbi:energy transducer TonB [Kordiimonas sp.]|uniref:energy transducer TonB n=1 Tax=Kordiimonas sp. TaxID=1970157 RepID=UPI003A9060BF
MTSYARVFPILTGAMLGTFSLFFLMQALVKNDGLNLIDEGPSFKFIDIIEEIKTNPVREVDRLPQPPEPVEVPPTEIIRTPPGGGLEIDLSARPQGPIQATNDRKIQLGFSDGERLPLVRVQPQYPRRALERGIEGSVVVEFTVTEDGTVADAHVIEATPEGYFERAALTAISKFKYKPTVVDGKAYASKGVRFRMAFELAGDQ